MDQVGRGSRLLPSIQQALIVQFVAGVPARTASARLGVNRNSAVLFFHQQRQVVAENVARETPFLSGETEVDESCFGGATKAATGAIFQSGIAIARVVSQGDARATSPHAARRAGIYPADYRFKPLDIDHGLRNGEERDCGGVRVAAVVTPGALFANGKVLPPRISGIAANPTPAPPSAASRGSNSTCCCPATVRSAYWARARSDAALRLVDRLPAPEFFCEI